MLGLDTNVLVRLLVRDDQEQFDRARRWIARQVDQGEAVLISQLVILETEWVLRSRYSLSKLDIISTLSSLLDVSELNFEGEGSVEEALFTWRDSSARFADCLISAQHRRLGCRATATFDARASKLYGFTAI